MTVRLSARALIVAFVVASAAARGAAQAPARPDEIAGRWIGTSICVKADWNASCNDERVVYFFERTDSATKLILHAYKYVGAALESMGDLPATYDATTKAWVAPFSNARVNIRWRFHANTNGTLAGDLLVLGRNQVARNVEARRDSIQTPPQALR